MPATTKKKTGRKTTRKTAKRATKKVAKKLAKKSGRQKCAAIITVKGAPKYSAAGAREVAKWLRQQAKFVEENFAVLANTFTARYLYE